VLTLTVTPLACATDQGATAAIRRAPAQKLRFIVDLLSVAVGSTACRLRRSTGVRFKV
jgi:hypothetical protein